MTEHWMTYVRTDLYRDAASKAYAYRLTSLEIDADGAPNAYAPGNKGLDTLANANYPDGKWQDILVPDPAKPSEAYVRPAGPGKGCFISKTTLANATLADTADGKYADAASIPYIVFPGNFYHLSGTGFIGDFVIAINLLTQKLVGGVVADVGPASHPLEEVSMAMVSALGGKDPNPRKGTGVPKGAIGFIVFPGSCGQLTWPLDAAAIDATARKLLAAAGGLATFASAFEPALV